MAAARKPRTTDTAPQEATTPGRIHAFLATPIHDPVTALEACDALFRDAIDPEQRTTHEQAYRGSLTLLNLSKIANEARAGGWLVERAPKSRPMANITVVTAVPFPDLPPDEPA